MIKRVMTCIKWFSASLAGIVIVLLLAVAGILFTNQGLNTVLWGVKKALPELSVHETEGALFPRFTLHGVAFNDEDLALNVKLEKLTLALNVNCLLEPMVCINDVVISGLAVNLPQWPEVSEDTDVEPSDPITHFSSPIPIKLGRLTLENIDLNLVGNRIAWQHFSTGASLQNNRLRIDPTRWKGVRVALVESASETQSRHASDTEHAPISLPEVIIPLRVELSRFELNDFTLQQATPIRIHRLALQAQASQSEVNIKSLELDMPELEASLSAKATLKGDYPLNLTLSSLLKLDEVKGQTLQLQATGSVADLSLNAQLAGRATATIAARIEPLKTELPFDVRIEQLDAQWPINGDGEYFIVAPHMAAKGSLEHYQLELQSEFSGQDIPDQAVTLQGEGSLTQLILHQLKLNTLGGEIQGQAMVDWADLVHWQATLKMREIQPEIQWPDIQGRVSGQLETSGQLTAQGGWKVDLPLLDIQGEIRGYPLDIKGQLTADDVVGRGEFRMSTSGLTLAHGPNAITAKGRLDKDWRMNIALNLKELDKTVPDLFGQVQGDIVLRGAFTEPNVRLALQANKLAWQEQVTIQQMNVVGEVVPMPVPNGNLRLTVDGIGYQDQTIDHIVLTLAGEQKKHQLTLAVESELAATHLAVQGRLDDSPRLIWQGQLERMDVLSEQGRWVLNQATDIHADLDQPAVTIAPHCWLQGASSLCLTKEATLGEQGEVDLAITQFAFQQMADFLPQDTQLQGELNAHLWAKWSPESPPQVDLSVQLPSGEVQQTLDQPVILGWDNIVIHAQLANNRLNADWLLNMTDNGDLSGQLLIPDVTQDEKQLEAAIKLTPLNIDFLAPLIGEYSQAKSTMTADLTVQGNLLHPQAFGQFAIHEMALTGDISPLEIHSGQLTIDFTGYQAVLNAGIETADGTLNITGDADWLDLDDWRVNSHVAAESLMVDLPPMVKMKVVPDLTLAMQPEKANITGSISLPWGRITVEELPPSAVEVSKDQVLLSRDLIPIDESTPLPLRVETEVTIMIGDDVRLSAFGLQGELIGRLNVTQKDQGPFIVGEVNIFKGQYRSFGQDLLIQEGKILMNGPVDQPYLSIKAIRNPDNTQDDVIAGVQVTGSADEPAVSIFSEPVMPQANALSYLLRGQDIDGEAGGNAMTTTLIGLSLAQSGKVVGKIGEGLGVQDLQLDTAGSGDDSQVTVSGYILPGLQVKYGVGIFNSVGEFTVRYRLMKDLYLEAVSGVDSAIDILYRFEFN
ncbi:translocation/assembly module TamB [Vibrio cincinnatiensis]|uniref:autotransporter assembly complex protein TamB n=1 Tax=Vibrio cincinnatiensis TaxID=675 RepID=UPI001EDE8231|nr:translocation/assembly module TamB domain-containing protein [Vibrio cincinnatiensis]MCG3742980.1 translocation/assembly module TamB [Vibrio cincinnatiensis]